MWETFKKAKHLDQCSGNIGNQQLMITYHTCDVSVNMGEKTGFLLCDWLHTMCWKGSTSATLPVGMKSSKWYVKVNEVLLSVTVHNSMVYWSIYQWTEWIPKHSGWCLFWASSIQSTFYFLKSSLNITVLFMYSTSSGLFQDFNLNFVCTFHHIHASYMTRPFVMTTQIISGEE